MSINLGYFNLGIFFMGFLLSLESYPAALDVLWSVEPWSSADAGASGDGVEINNFIGFSCYKRAFT